jgi:hypothetical protein
MPSTTLSTCGLERRILAVGPAVCAGMVHEVGGIKRAGAIMGVSFMTLVRWLYEIPSRDVCTAGKGCSSCWPGYPAPFPALDRVVELVLGREESYLGQLCTRRGCSVAEILDWMLRNEFGFISLELSKDVLSEAIGRCHLSATTARRLMSSCSYPRQLSAFDALARHCGHRTWLEAVLFTDAGSIRHEVPQAALLCLSEHLLSEWTRLS